MNLKRLFPVFFFIVFVCIGCSSSPNYYHYAFNPDQDRKLAVVAVAPLNLISPMPSQIGNRDTPIYQSIVSYLTSHGVRSEQTTTAARNVWEEEQKKVGGIYNAADGSLDQNKFDTSLRAAAEKLCRTYSVDAIVFPQIVLRMAALEGTSIQWDGTLQYLESEDGYVDSSRYKFSGHVLAISLEIVIIDKNGRLVLKNVAGMEQLYLVDKSDRPFKWTLRKNMLTDKARIKEAVAVGLHPFIVYPDYPSKPRFSEK